MGEATQHVFLGSRKQGSDPRRVYLVVRTTRAVVDGIPAVPGYQ
jgi:hypothetical protein